MVLRGVNVTAGIYARKCFHQLLILQKRENAA
jgi:hypothetical protein